MWKTQILTDRCSQQILNDYRWLIIVHARLLLDSLMLENAVQCLAMATLALGWLFCSKCFVLREYSRWRTTIMTWSWLCLLCLIITLVTILNDCHTACLDMPRVLQKYSLWAPRVMIRGNVQRQWSRNCRPLSYIKSRNFGETWPSKLS